VSDASTPRPEWPGAAAAPAAPAPPAHRRAVDLKLVIAVLIGLVSVTGAALAWKSAISSEKATDKDRQAVAETVTVEQARADTEVIVQDARARFAEHAINVLNADLLDQQAEVAASQGDGVRARAASDEAVELRAVGRRVLEGTLGPVFLADYVTAGEEGARPTFDETALSRDLDRIAAAQNQLDPVQTIREADRLRAESERFDRWLIFMVGAVVVLTLAQVTGRRVLRVVLAGAGTAVWVVTAVLAFTGN
jgi:hypothetical protein